MVANIKTFLVVDEVQFLFKHLKKRFSILEKYNIKQNESLVAPNQCVICFAGYGQNIQNYSTPYYSTPTRFFKVYVK